MFLYGMNLMSSGLQKAAGDKLRSFLSAMTSNPAKGVLTGLGVTTVIQSSSATTVMVVSFVNAGLLTLAQAISVIMGANIGTTVTAWMVAFLGFKADISLLAVPMMLLGFLFSNSKKNQYQNIGELIVGFSLLFLGLSFMKNSVPDLRETPQVLEFVTTSAGVCDHLGKPRLWFDTAVLGIWYGIDFGVAIVFCHHGYHAYHAQHGLDTFPHGMCDGVGREYRYDHHGEYRGIGRKYASETRGDVTHDLQCVWCDLGVDIVQTFHRLGG